MSAGDCDCVALPFHPAVPAVGESHSVSKQQDRGRHREEIRIDSRRVTGKHKYPRLLPRSGNRSSRTNEQFEAFISPCAADSLIDLAVDERPALGPVSQRLTRLNVVEQTQFFAN